MVTWPKKKINTTEDDYYKQLSENKYVKESLDEFLVKKEENKDKKKLSWEEWKKLLFEFCNINKRTPIQKEEYKNVNIGIWLNEQKKKINSNGVYQKLSENIYVKESLDSYLNKKRFNWLLYHDW